MELKKILGLVVGLPLVATGAMVASPAAVSAATVVVVSHDGQHGWHSRVTDGGGIPDATYGSVTFVTGPDTPPHGTGSLRLMTNSGKGDGSAQMRNTNYGGVQLSALTELNYWAYHNLIASSPNQQQWPYLSLDVSCGGCTGGSGSNSDRLFFEPPYQQPLTGGSTCALPGQNPTITNRWQPWDALKGCWWDNGGELGSGGTDTKPLSDFISAHPDATIFNPNGLGGLRLLVGFASPTDQFDGNVDLVTVGVNGTSTSYDFEPPTCKEADGNGDFHSQEGRHGNFQMDNDKCEESGHGGNGESDQGDSVDSTDRGDGKDFHSTNIETTQFDAVAGTVTITGVGTTNGIPVAFTFVAVQSGIASLGTVSLVLSDGYSIAGELVDGSIALS